METVQAVKSVEGIPNDHDCIALTGHDSTMVVDGLGLQQETGREPK